MIQRPNADVVFGKVVSHHECSNPDILPQKSVSASNGYLRGSTRTPCVKLSFNLSYVKSTIKMSVSSVDLQEQEKSVYSSFKANLFHAIASDNFAQCHAYLNELEQPSNHKLTSLYIASEFKAIADDKQPYLQLLKDRNKLTVVGLYQAINEHKPHLFWWYLPHILTIIDCEFNLSLLMCEVILRCIELGQLQLFIDIETYINFKHPDILGVIVMYTESFVHTATCFGNSEFLKYMFNGCKLVDVDLKLDNGGLLHAYINAVKCLSVECIEVLSQKFSAVEYFVDVYDPLLIVIEGCSRNFKHTQPYVYSKSFTIACMLLDMFSMDSQFFVMDTVASKCVEHDALDLLQYCINKCHFEVNLRDLLHQAIISNSMWCFKWLLFEVNTDRNIPEDLYLDAVTHLRYQMLLLLEEFNGQVRLLRVYHSLEYVLAELQYDIRHDSSCLMFLLKKVWPCVLAKFFQPDADFEALLDIVEMLNQLVHVLRDEAQIATDLCLIISRLPGEKFNILDTRYPKIIEFLKEAQALRSQAITTATSNASTSVPSGVIDQYVLTACTVDLERKKPKPLVVDE